MLIPLGFLASASGGVDSSYELIESQILGSSQTSITFSSLGTYSSTYKHLQLRMAVRSSGAYTQTYLEMNINADTGNNYAHHELTGNGSSVSSSAGSTRPSIRLGLINANTSTSNVFSGLVVDLLDPYSTSKNTTARSFMANNGTNFVGLFSGLWMNTASVTSLTIKESTGLLTGSRFSLYGLK